MTNLHHLHLSTEPLLVRHYKAGKALCMCGCGKPVKAAIRNYGPLGYVKGQPLRYRLGHGSRPRPKPVAERFWPKVKKGDICWTWQAAKQTQGYGVFSVSGRLQRAHRVAYELLVGPIPDGLELDHLCRNPACVNPDHLEPVTHAENMRRGGRAYATHCPKGHPYRGDNLQVLSSGKRRCRTCMREWRRQYDQRQKAKR